MAGEPDLTAACAAAYAHPAVRWLLGGDLHPGGARTTRRALELISLRPGEALLDVASGYGSSALLAAREFGCLVSGVDYSAEVAAEAQTSAEAEGLCDRVGFIRGDCASLPFADGSFDAVLCECSLSAFPDQARALGEIHRVLRPGGRVAISDVTATRERLPGVLRNALAAVACVAGALSVSGYERLLSDAGFDLIATERRDDDAASMAERITDRLSGARLLGYGRFSVGGFEVDDAFALSAVAQRAIDEGSLGYAIFAGARR
jgi:SAM-dependent methyltransferase